MNNKFTKCLITGAEDLYPLKGYEDNFLVKSRSSGFVFCSKKPTEQELIDFYGRYPIGYNDDSELNKKRINERLDEFETYRKENKILDVGCGNGMFLEEAKKRGWEVYGTEFTDKQVEYLKNKGINTLQGRLQNDSFKENYFDVIISSEVIEHINNPLEEMQHFYRILRKGGLVYITTPNFNAVERFFLKNNYEIIDYPNHLCYYTADTINKLLISQGFNRLKITTTGLSIDRIKKGWSAKKNEPIQSPTSSDEKLRESMEKGYKKGLKALINSALNITRTGNSLKAWYVKP